MPDRILTLVVVLLPTLFAVALEVVSKELRGSRFWRIAVLAFGVATSLLTWLQISRADEAHERDQKELKDKLDQSLLTQQYTKGQLDSLALMVGKIGQPSPENSALATAIKQMAQAHAQNVTDLKALSSELCERAHAEARAIRNFQDQYDVASRAEQESYMDRYSRTPQGTGRDAVWSEMTQHQFSEYQVHDAQFRNKFLSDAKYMRDLLLERLPPKTADALRAQNGEAEAYLQIGTRAGAGNERIIATYLDELADGLCSSQPKLK
jgi:hypothetical protein